MAAGSPGVINIDGEHSLVTIKASSTTATASIGPSHIAANIALGSFEIQDSLASAAAPSLRYLARSAASTHDGSDEEFFDADASLSRTSVSSAISTSSEQFEDASDQPGSHSAGNEAACLPGAAQHHAWVLEFESWKPDSSEYLGLDAQLQTRLTSLHFFCNRPTVAALMCLGTDLTDALKAGQPASAQAPAQPRQLESQESVSDFSSLEEPGEQHCTSLGLSCSYCRATRHATSIFASSDSLGISVKCLLAAAVAAAGHQDCQSLK